MMKSIRVKLFIGILLIVSILLGGIFTYGILFKGYFQNETLDEMEQVVEHIEKIIDENHIDEVATAVAGCSEMYNVQIDIQSVGGKTIFATHGSGKGNGMSGMGGMNKFEVVEEISSNGNIENMIVHDRSTGVYFLTTEKIIGNNQYIIIVKTPINIVEDAARKSIKLLLIIFMPMTVFILILTFIFAKGFTKPIIAITRKTSKITTLDFSEDIKVKGKDEIAVLCNSVNELSHKIENTLEELNKKNDTLEKMINKERENEEIRREFVSSVSHELKSPIAVISGYAQVLKEKVISTEEDKDYYVGVIDEEAERMQVIVNDLLDLYKLESNTFKLETKEVQLGGLVDKILRKNKLRFEELGINLETSIDEVLVMGDEIRLEQAIQNYINNGLSHVNHEKIIKIIVTASGYISVYNSGTPILSEHLEKIWQGFVRADKVRNYKEKRVGLGLSIVKQIVKLHKGQCGVLNKENGVEFWIKLITV